MLFLAQGWCKPPSSYVGPTAEPEEKDHIKCIHIYIHTRIHTYTHTTYTHTHTHARTHIHIWCKAFFFFLRRSHSRT